MLIIFIEQLRNRKSFCLINEIFLWKIGSLQIIFLLIFFLPYNYIYLLLDNISNLTINEWSS